MLYAYHVIFKYAAYFQIFIMRFFMPNVLVLKL